MSQIELNYRQTRQFFLQNSRDKNNVKMKQFQSENDFLSYQNHRYHERRKKKMSSILTLS